MGRIINVSALLFCIYVIVHILVGVYGFIHIWR